MNLSVAEAKRDFKRGFLKSFTLTRSAMEPGWWVLLNDINGGQPMLTDAKTKNPRLFKSLDSAINTARDIGFKAENFTCNN